MQVKVLWTGLLRRIFRKQLPTPFQARLKQSESEGRSCGLLDAKTRLAVTTVFHEVDCDCVRRFRKHCPPLSTCWMGESWIPTPKYWSRPEPMSACTPSLQPFSTKGMKCWYLLRTLISISAASPFMVESQSMCHSDRQRKPVTPMFHQPIGSWTLKS